MQVFLLMLALSVLLTAITAILLYLLTQTIGGGYDE